MTFAPSTTEISRCLTIQESREWLTIALVYAALVVLLTLWAWPWLNCTPPMTHVEDSWTWRAVLAAAMGEPLVIGLGTVEWRDDE